MNYLAPVIVFAYNRLSHLQQTIESLKKNNLASESTLYIYSDAAKNLSSISSVEKVRSYIKNIEGFQTVVIVERENNFGLAQSIISGVTEIINKHGAAIVVEDDIVTSKYFLQFMNESLQKYEKDDRVVCVHGYCYPVHRPLPETYFLRGAECWGWATWKRGWEIFEPDAKKLLREIQQKKMQHEIDYDGMFPFTQMLRNQMYGRIDSWAIRWQVSAFLKNKLTLYPGHSLVKNIGEGESATHTSSLKHYTTDLYEQKIHLNDIPVEETPVARIAYVEYFRNIRPPWIIRSLKFVKTMLLNMQYSIRHRYQ